MGAVPPAGVAWLSLQNPNDLLARAPNCECDNQRWQRFGASESSVVCSPGPGDEGPESGRDFPFVCRPRKGKGEIPTATPNETASGVAVVKSSVQKELDWLSARHGVGSHR